MATPGSERVPNAESATFERHRDMLMGLAYRMLGAIADAQDMVQETWLRWTRLGDARRAAVREPRAWLLRTCSRLCLDQLKSARVQREVYPGPWLPEPLVLDVAVTDDGVVAADGARRLELDESVSMALLTAMERLTPAERAALLLHDVFDHDYAEISAAIGRSETACRKLVSRARSRVRTSPEAPASPVNPEEHRRLLHEFMTAAAAGDFAGLKAVLCDDVTFRADGGGKVVAAGKVLEGADVVARFFVGIVTRTGARYDAPRRRWCWFNGAPGALVLDGPDGQPSTALSIRVRDGRIAELYALRNPDKLVWFRQP